MKMVRNAFCAAAVACGSVIAIAPTQAMAQSAVSLYGLLDLSAGRFQTAGTPQVNAVQSGDMSTSFFGFSGDEDLGGGLKAVFKLESFLRVNSGTPGRFDGDAFFARNSYIGLTGDFGSVTLGRNGTPLFVTTLLSNAFADSFGFSPSIHRPLRLRPACCRSSATPPGTIRLPTKVLRGVV